MRLRMYNTFLDNHSEPASLSGYFCYYIDFCILGNYNIQNTKFVTWLHYSSIQYYCQYKICI